MEVCVGVKRGNFLNAPLVVGFYEACLFEYLGWEGVWSVDGFCL
jgi:hypothetical protein